MDMNDPLDFEVEDDLLKSHAIKKKRKKVIGLDDLLQDHYREQNKLLESRNKQKKANTKAKKSKTSYDEEDSKEAKLTRLVEKCHKQLKAFGEEEDIPPWGVKVFGDKKLPPAVEFPDLRCCNLLHSFLNNKLNSVVELNVDKGNIFLEGLLVNGWLSKLVFLCGHVEKSVAIWAFNTMLYSSKEELFNSSTDFWCAILSSEEEVNQMPVKIDWFPEYADLRRALDIYGFLFKFSSTSEPNNSDSDIEGRPPQNTRAWIRFVTVCSLIRSKKEIFSTTEAEEIVEIIICLFLDRQFLGLLVLLKDCMEAIVNYFTDQEWCSSCENIAKFIACRVSKDLNCIQTIECISEATSRCKQLRSAVAHQTLLSCFHGVNSGEEILRSLTEINFKDKSSDFYKMYIHLVLTENWVLSNSSIKDNPVIYEMFCLYLENCSTLISATNLRSYASKVRHRASYLLHFSIYK
ncbi:hypothetical protein LR48_Vigan08g147000 [Vigna angularis]|uniref:Coiled-coil SMC6 And NSE5 INteracting (CANIN) domain-containing protein n=2 Tax=Phaseolus angularis TaxID=3914 RepID=A0A0L9V6M8_PHAAN|nr:uncharacterized protein LOC108339785 [Vigna angularis]KAG2397529.1 uncharacterized protein HKW66_Vig0142350 [Vigna angularis]KOM50643.1 hypothetical protein LR48_Vigan08g147000 [Vigna angularis]BAT90508.1 hypothetical protein VIGAN_06176400 [Vigna angularis var. angularis]